MVFVGCAETGYFVGRKLLEAGLLPQAIVSLDPSAIAKHKVSGYKCLFDLAPDVVHYQPQRYDLKSPLDYKFFSHNKYDILVILGWQRLIPDPIIGTLGICGLTIHGSAEGLPKGRGRSPLNWALIEGHRSFSLSLLTVEGGADAGRIIDTREFDILPADTIRTLYYKNGLASAQMMIDKIPLLTRDSGVEQDDSLASYYPKRSPEDGCIKWAERAVDIEGLVRAVTRPYPGAFTYWNGQKLMIWQGQTFDTKLTTGCEPGRVGAVFPDGSFLVGTGTHDFLILDYEGPCPQEGDIFK
ncbi:MAG: hypothetical protein LBT47_10060 [Deltaproteobacteria bacterium]|jgi:methionyl-tRNA formyltransferase|nr:hypothetical protein [Deltaproteobacteria bacterium]